MSPIIIINQRSGVIRFTGLIMLLIVAGIAATPLPPTTTTAAAAATAKAAAAAAIEATTTAALDSTPPPPTADINNEKGSRGAASGQQAQQNSEVDDTTGETLGPGEVLNIFVNSFADSEPLETTTPATVISTTTTTTPITSSSTLSSSSSFSSSSSALAATQDDDQLVEAIKRNEMLRKGLTIFLDQTNSGFHNGKQIPTSSSVETSGGSQDLTLVSSDPSPYALIKGPNRLARRRPIGGPLRWG